MSQRPIKRKRTNDNEPPPVDRLTHVYLIIRTDFADDYGRGCGEDPADTATIGPFASEVTAQRALKNDQLSHVVELMEDQSLWGDDLAEYWETNESGTKELDYNAVEEELDFLVERVLKGEFVRCKHDWVLQKLEIIY